MAPTTSSDSRAHVQSAKALFRTGDAMALPVPDQTFDAVVSALALNFFPDPVVAATEWARAVKPDGVVAAYVWDYAGRTQFLRHFECGRRNRSQSD
ncbi:MAG: class I SAM-dependent methyltransferase [Gemmatimonadaceae bacterium]